MIKAKFILDGKPAWLFGIDAENVRRLKAGDAMRINMEEIGGQGTIYIAYGASLAEIQKEFNLPVIQ